MIRHTDGPILFSHTDLTEFVACNHLTQLSLAAALGERTRPFSRAPFAELIQRKGKEHEASLPRRAAGSGFGGNRDRSGRGVELCGGGRAGPSSPWAHP